MKNENKLSLAAMLQKVQQAQARAHICHCNHTHEAHQDGRCSAQSFFEGVVLPCPCRSCFCFNCFLEEKKRRQA